MRSRPYHCAQLTQMVVWPCSCSWDDELEGLDHPQQDDEAFRANLQLTPQEQVVQSLSISGVMLVAWFSHASLSQNHHTQASEATSVRFGVRVPHALVHRLCTSVTTRQSAACTRAGHAVAILWEGPWHTQARFCPQRRSADGPSFRRAHIVPAEDACSAASQEARNSA